MSPNVAHSFVFKACFLHSLFFRNWNNLASFLCLKCAKASLTTLVLFLHVIVVRCLNLSLRDGYYQLMLNSVWFLTQIMKWEKSSSPDRWVGQPWGAWFPRGKKKETSGMWTGCWDRACRECLHARIMLPFCSTLGLSSFIEYRIIV